MEFFASHDWLNRPGSTYAFKLDHLLFILIAMLIGVALCFILRGKDKKIIKATGISLWGIAVVSEILYYVVTIILCVTDPENHHFSIDGSLPLHSCSMFLYIFPVAIFSKNRIIKTATMNFLVVINMIIGFITLFVGCPPGGYSALSFPGVHTLLWHSIIVIVPLIMVVTNYYDIQIQDFKYGLALFGILSVIMWTFDAIAHCDYFYFYDGHTFPVFKEISENVPHIVWTLIVVSSYVITGAAIHFLIIGIKYLINKRKAQQ